MPMRGGYTTSYDTEKMDKKGKCSQCKEPGYDDIGTHMSKDKSVGPKVNRDKMSKKKGY